MNYIVILFKRNVVYESDQLLDSLIDFVVENNLSKGWSPSQY